MGASDSKSGGYWWDALGCRRHKGKAYLPFPRLSYRGIRLGHMQGDLVRKELLKGEPVPSLSEGAVCEQRGRRLTSSDLRECRDGELPCLRPAPGPHCHRPAEELGCRALRTYGCFPQRRLEPAPRTHVMCPQSSALPCAGGQSCSLSASK